jgi:two-component system, OmpR family, sensor histidine kinase KdpD
MAPQCIEGTDDMTDYRRNGDHRPSPDALLEAARRVESRAGKLKIFLGAAPGVGKTYEMLQQGRARKADGCDVIVGVVETHGRRETEALVAGFEIVPRQQVDYKGRQLDEMDLDAILARRPQIVLVDELAHTNVPGSRHPKRYLDVEELLERGIDVYTTVNIQHLESLNDVVAQITGVRVRETLPDSIFDRADAIEIVDLTPDDLIQRLKEGKVYVPHQAQRALQHYFSTGNLTALRELALRRTAQQVDDQLFSHMRTQAISGPWAAGERVLVLIGEEPEAAGLVRYTKRLADRLRGRWSGLHIANRRGLHLSEEEQDRIADTLRLVERLGGEAVTVAAGSNNIIDDIMAYAQANNVTHMVIGKSLRSRWFEILHGSIVHDLVRHCGHISVHVISAEAGLGEPVPKKTVSTAEKVVPFDPVPYAFAAAAVALATAAGAVVRPWFGTQSIDLFYLAAVVSMAVRFGLAPSLFASAIAIIVYKYLFVPPLYSLDLNNSTVVVMSVVFIACSIIVARLVDRVRLQSVVATTRARTTEALYNFSRKLSGIGTLDDVLWATAYQAASMLKLRVVVLLPENGSIAVKAGYPPEDTLDSADLAAATWAWESNRPAGRGADTLPGARRLFLPMRTGRGAIGVVGIDGDKPGPLLTPDGRRLLDALIDQGALAIERVQLVGEMDRSKRAVEADRLRSALLTSISHDLKTPLAAILGSAGTMRDFSRDLTDAEKADLLSNIIDESERLNRFIANLLDMTKLESGAIAPNSSLHDLRELVGSALRRAKKILNRHQVELDFAEDIPMVNLDDVLFEQVLFNLLDNASKYAPPQTKILVRVFREPKSVCLQICDEGPGIPPDEIDQIFDKFYRVQKSDHVLAGTGLGLAISRGFIEAMQGSISAANRTDGPGAAFTLRLPIPDEPNHLDTAA